MNDYLYIGAAQCCVLHHQHNVHHWVLSEGHHHLAKQHTTTWKSGWYLKDDHILLLTFTGCFAGGQRAGKLAQETRSLRDCEIWAASAGALAQRLWPADSRLPRPAGVVAQCTCESNHQLFFKRKWFKFAGNSCSRHKTGHFLLAFGYIEW